MNLLDTLHSCEGFDWDQHNYYKNWLKHLITPIECEEVFDNEPLLLDNDLKHSQSEARHLAYGKTNMGKRLLICYTIRNSKVRIISARQMNQAERTRHDKAN